MLVCCADWSLTVNRVSTAGFPIMSAVLLITPVTTCMACSVQAALPQWHSRPIGQLHDPVQQELLWLGAWHTECASASAGTWRHSDSSAATGAEPHTGVAHSSICCPTGKISSTHSSYMRICRHSLRCQKRKEKSTLFSINLMRTQVLYQAAQAQNAMYTHQPLLTIKRCTIQKLSISRCLCCINAWLQQAPVDILVYISCCADIQVAIRNTQQGVFYFTDQIPLTALMVEDGRIEPAAFVQSWKNLPEANESQKELPISITSLDMVKSKIEAANIFLMAHKQVRLLAVLFAELHCQYLHRYDMRLLAG